MKRIMLVLGLGFATVCEASNPVADKNKFETAYVNCMQKSFADGCWVKTLAGHALPWVDDESKVLTKSDAAFSQWLEGKAIYKVHPGIKELKGGIFDNRSYVLERDDGAVVAVWFSFRQFKGNWYVYEVMASSNDEFIRNAIGMIRPKEGKE